MYLTQYIANVFISPGNEHKKIIEAAYIYFCIVSLRNPMCILYSEHFKPD